MAKVVEHLPCKLKLKALSSNPGTIKKKKKERKKENKENIQDTKKHKPSTKNLLTIKCTTYSP
jgi:hypothetical protein